MSACQKRAREHCCGGQCKKADCPLSRPHGPRAASAVNTKLIGCRASSTAYIIPNPGFRLWLLDASHLVVAQSCSCLISALLLSCSRSPRLQCHCKYHCLYLSCCASGLSGFWLGVQAQISFWIRCMTLTTWVRPRLHSPEHGFGSPAALDTWLTPDSTRLLMPRHSMHRAKLEAM